MSSKIELFAFLKQLENRKIYYQLNKFRDDNIAVNIVVPGQRWEIEFSKDGEIEIEKFISDGKIYNDDEVEVLFRNFTD
jgi:hypothetical protein